MIIDLKRSIDRRWLFDPVLLFILRWSCLFGHLKQPCSIKQAMVGYFDMQHSFIPSASVTLIWKMHWIWLLPKNLNLQILKAPANFTQVGGAKILNKSYLCTRLSNENAKFGRPRTEPDVLIKSIDLLGFPNVAMDISCTGLRSNDLHETDKRV